MHFGRRPRPVFRAEGKDGDDADADFAGRADRPPQCLDAAPVAFDTRQPARRRPTAVAIHDDGNMARHLARHLSRLGQLGVGRDCCLGHG